MAPTKQKKISKPVNPVQQPTPPTQDESSDSYNGFEPDDPVEKSDTELELEKLVFGDDAGFKEGLSSYRAGRAVLSPENDNKDLQDEGEDLGGLDDADLFFLDTEPSATQSQGVLAPKIPQEDHDIHNDGSAPAWVDSDDERIMVSLASNSRLRKLRLTESEDLVNGREYTKRLRQQFERLYPVPEWANPPLRRKPSYKKRRRTSGATSSSESDGSASDMSVDSDSLSAPPLSQLLQNTHSILQPPSTTSTTHRKLRPSVIDIQRSKDVGAAQPSAISSLTFHPTYPLLLSSGPASTLSLHHISPHPPHPNPLLTSLHIAHTPLTTSTFSPRTTSSGNKIYFSGRRRHLHTWDLTTGRIEKISHPLPHQRSMERFQLSPCGRWLGLVGSGRKGSGTINILNALTTQWVSEARVEGKGGVADFAWWGDGDGLTVLGKGGEAIEYSIRERKVLARWIDDGAVGTTVIALGGSSPGAKNLGGDRWLAVGSSSGIVNLYDRTLWNNKEGAVSARPVPTKVLDQLTTPTSVLAFSQDGQLLCMASRWKKDALRLVHLPSCTVYRNWPTAGTPLGRVCSVAWSREGGWLAVGNEGGRVRLWQVGG